jgi:hypothetical protein
MNRTNTSKRNSTLRRGKISQRQLRLIQRQNAARIRNGTFLPNLPRVNPRRRIVTRNNQGRTSDMLPSRIDFQPPRQQTANNQSRIVHREPLATILGSTGFAITTFNINPGLAATFPWMSNQARGYESYRVNSMAIEYKFTTNEFIGKGRIVIAPDYDAGDPAPTSALQAEQMSDSVMGAVAKNWTCRLRPRGMGILGPKRFIRGGALSANEDIKTYDIAQVHIVTSGQTDTSEIGQLWISYDITLTEPQPISPSNEFLAGLLISPDGVGGSTTHLLGTDAVASGAIVMSVIGNVVSVSELIEGQQYRLIYVAFAAVVTTTPTIALDGVNLVSVNNPIYASAADGVEGIAVVSFIAHETHGTLTIGGISVLTTPTELFLEIEGMVTDPLV